MRCEHASAGDDEKLGEDLGPPRSFATGVKVAGAPKGQPWEG